ncbi:MAG: hypothetical protein L6R28_00465 [Planctomycetes bacterium]|nr:hypothetical protein [Planctomycetota bacterium]
MTDHAPKPPKLSFRYQTSDLLLAVALCGLEGFAFAELLRAQGNVKALYAAACGMALGVLFMVGGGYMAVRHCEEHKIASRGKRLLSFLMVNLMLLCFVGAAFFYFMGR